MVMQMDELPCWRSILLIAHMSPLELFSFYRKQDVSYSLVF